MIRVSGRLLVCAVIGLVGSAGLATSVGIAQQRAAAAMASSAGAFLSSLTPGQKPKVAFPLDSDEWTRWHFIPVSMFPRHGLPLKEMTEAQRQRAHDLLKASLSQAGYKIATATMQNETLLGSIEAAARTAAAAT